MAVVRTGALVADVRGKLGDYAYARNRGGLYVRTIGTVTQPGGARQTAVQNAMKFLAQAWGGTLSAAQRERWTGVAAQQMMPDRWGGVHPLTGKELFIKLNFPWYQKNGVWWIVDCPDDPIRHRCSHTLSWFAGPPAVEIDLPLGWYPSPTEQLWVFAYASKPVSQTINYFEGPWRLWTENWFTGGSWANDPWWDWWPWTLGSGDRVWVELIMSHGTEGWISERSRATLDIP